MSCCVCCSRKYFYIFVVFVALLGYYLKIRIENRGDNGFGSTTTAEEATEGINLSGKIMIVTGASTGIGYESARVLALRGAKVILHARSLEKAQDAIQKARMKHPGVVLDFIPLAMDLSSLKSIRKFTEDFKQLNLPLHSLILNAAVIPNEKKQSEDGFEMQMAVTHIGHFYLTQLLLDVLESSKPSRVVIVSSEAHTMSNGSFINSTTLEAECYIPFDTYANTKLANVLFAKELDNLYNHRGITAVSLHPGAAMTPLTVGLIQDYFGNFTIQLLSTLETYIFKTMTQVSSTVAYCATCDLTNLGGRYFCDTHVCVSYWENMINEGRIGKLLWKHTEALIQYALDKHN